LSLTISILA